MGDRHMAIVKDAAISEIMQSLRRIFKAIQDYSRQVSKAYGITGPQLWVIKTISLNRGLLLRDLAERMYLHPSTITGLIDALEAKGYVTRVRGTADRRVVKVQLTPKGRRLAKMAPEPAQGKMINGLTHLKNQEVALIHRSVKKLVTMMEAQNLKVTFFFDEG
jgi:MarR family transcriptional regulator, organic hydroperoxide resistance regulator